MSLSQALVNIACLGTDWLLWLLVGLSVLSFQIILDRGCFFWKRRIDADWLAKQLFHLLRAGEVTKARNVVSRTSAPECIVLAAGLSEIARGANGAEGAMQSALARERLRMESGLTVLGLIGRYAPLIGLLATLLGLSAALHTGSTFDELAMASTASPNFADALAGGALGLFVGIPAGIGCRFLRRHVQTVVTRSESLSQLVLAQAQDYELLAIEALKKPLRVA